MGVTIPMFNLLAIDVPNAFDDAVLAKILQVCRAVRSRAALPAAAPAAAVPRPPVARRPSLAARRAPQPLLLTAAAAAGRACSQQQQSRILQQVQQYSTIQKQIDMINAQAAQQIAIINANATAKARARAPPPQCGHARA